MKSLLKKTAENYAEHPLIVLSRNRNEEIARVTADENGNYRVALPPGDYILDVQRRPPKGHIRAKPQSFTIISNQTLRVDMSIDSGIRCICRGVSRSLHAFFLRRWLPPLLRD
jgi:hypothetical protein